MSREAPKDRQPETTWQRVKRAAPLAGAAAAAALVATPFLTACGSPMGAPSVNAKQVEKEANESPAGEALVRQGWRARDISSQALYLLMGDVSSGRLNGDVFVGYREGTAGPGSPELVLASSNPTNVGSWVLEGAAVDHYGVEFSSIPSDAEAALQQARYDVAHRQDPNDDPSPVIGNLDWVGQ